MKCLENRAFFSFPKYLEIRSVVVNTEPFVTVGHQLSGSYWSVEPSINASLSLSHPGQAPTKLSRNQFVISLSLPLFSPSVFSSLSRVPTVSAWSLRVGSRCFLRGWRLSTANEALLKRVNTRCKELSKGTQFYALTLWPFHQPFLVPLLAKHLCPFVKVPIVQLLNCDCFTDRQLRGSCDIITIALLVDQ